MFRIFKKGNKGITSIENEEEDIKQKCRNKAKTTLF